MRSTQMDIHTDVSEHGPTFVIAGEIDLNTAPRAWETISSTVRETRGSAAVTVDLRGVIYVDSAGLALLLDVFRAKPADGQVRLLVTAGSQPDRVLRLGHFSQIFAIDAMPV